MSTFDNNWIESKQLKELFAMTDNSIDNDHNLIYQSLNNSDFSNDKKANKYLRDYSEIINYDFSLNKINNISLDELVKTFISKLLDNDNIFLKDFKDYMNENYTNINEEVLEKFEGLYDIEDFQKIANILEDYYTTTIKDNDKVKLLDSLLIYLGNI